MNKDLKAKLDDLILIDTEFQYHADLLEVSMVRLKRGNQIDKLSFYVKPHNFGSIDPDIEELTGITTNKILKEGLSEDEACNKIANFLQSGSAIGAYSGINDVFLIRRMFNRCNVKTPRCLKSRKYFDIEIISRSLLHKRDNKKRRYFVQEIHRSQTKMAKHFGIDVDLAKSHNSGYDIQILTKLANRVIPMALAKYHGLPIIRYEYTPNTFKETAEWSEGSYVDDPELINRLRPSHTFLDYTNRPEHKPDENFHEAKTLEDWLFMKYDLPYKTYERMSASRRQKLKEEFVNDTDANI